MFIRISDNVLEPTAWTIGRVEFDRHGTVVTQELVQEGAYRLPNCIGWSVAKLVEWQDFDPTGYHPETYNEVSRDGQRWKCNLSVVQVQELS